MNKFIKLNIYKIEFMSDQNGNTVGNETGETEPIYIAVDKILGFKPNKQGSHEDCYIFVLDMPEPLHIKDTSKEVLDLIPRD